MREASAGKPVLLGRCGGSGLSCPRRLVGASYAGSAHELPDAINFGLPTSSPSSKRRQAGPLEVGIFSGLGHGIVVAAKKPAFSADN